MTTGWEKMLKPFHSFPNPTNGANEPCKLNPQKHARSIQ